MNDLDRLVAQAQPRWARLGELVGRTRGLSGEEWTELAALYRALCADLARVQDDETVRRHLDALAARTHDVLYASRPPWTLRRVVRLLGEVPVEVRANAGWFWLATALFYGPAMLGGWMAWSVPDYAAAVVGQGALDAAAEAYQLAPRRSVAEDAAMAGFYVWNNIGIAFRCFATGAFAGLGSVFFLVYNGLVIGTTLSHVAVEGGGGNILEFCCGHAAWELTGIVLAGAAGLRMGWALIDTAGRTRREALALAAPSLVRLVIGVTLMLAVAAAIEGFWSASGVPRPVKHGFAVVQVVVVVSWLGLAGRGWDR